MILSSLIADFLEYLELEQNASQLTIRNYDHCLKRFLEFSGDIEPKDIDLNLVRRYKIYLAKFRDPKSKPLKKVTQNFFLIALRSFLRYLKEINVQSLAWDQVGLSVSNASPIKLLDEGQLQSLLEAPDTAKKDGIRDRAILESLLSSGLKVAEIVSLNRDNFNGEYFEIKGKKIRTIYLSDMAKEWLDKYLKVRKDSFKPLFIRFKGRVNPQNLGEAMRLTPRSIERIVEKYVKGAGLSIKATPAMLRHNFATKLLTKENSLADVQERLGHSNISTTRLYAKNLLG